MDGVTTTRKYLVDISGQLPTILCEIDTSDSSLKKSYVYADAQILAHREPTEPSDPAIYDQQFYVHDRLGSVRLVVDYNDIDEYVFVANSYTYTPFGDHYDGEAPAETAANPWQFTGQYFDAEINQYYLRARQYDPAMMRFTSRDPIRGEQNEPLTLHKYLYCVNDPIDRIDPSGEINAMAARLTSAVVTGYSLYGHGISLAAYSVDTGDDRFWELAETTFKFIPAALVAAVANPFGPMTNIGIYAVEGIYENTRGSVTGMSWAQAAAIDVVAYGLYYGVMLNHENKLGVDSNDMDDFKDWMGIWF